MFSAIGAVPQTDFPTLVDQAKSSAAENAIKMTVFQSDGADDVEVVPPVYTSEPPTIEEPTVRETGKASEAVAEPEVSDLVKKWSKKK